MDDWRITNQEKYLSGKRLLKKQFVPTERNESAKKMMELLHLSGYELTWALDMDLDRIKTLGKEYNEYWYESGSGFTNSPKYENSTTFTVVLLCFIDG